VWGDSGSLAIDQSDNFLSVLRYIDPNNAVIGDSIWKVGQRTGTTVGALISTSADYVDATETVRSQGLVDTYSDHGDSGAPLYKIDGTLFGMLVGGNQSQHRTYFSWWTNVRAEIGGTINELTDITVSQPAETGSISFGNPKLTWSVQVTNSTFPTYFTVDRELWNATRQQFDDPERFVYGPTTATTFTDTTTVDLYYGSSKPSDDVSWAGYHVYANNHGVLSIGLWVYFRRGGRQ
jgi:hypothetical protein